MQTGDSRMRFDARRWTWFEVVVAVAALVLLISPFQPWYDIRFAGCPGGACRADNRLGRLSGITVHDYLWVTFAAALAVLVLLALRALNRIAFFQTPNERQLLACLAVLNLVVVLVAFLGKPGFIALPAQGPPAPLPLPLLAVRWQYGAWLAVVAAVVAAAAAAGDLLRPVPVQQPVNP
jgi:hypothetical protein